MPTKLVLQQRGASGLNTVAEIPALENGKIDMSWLPVVGESGAAIIARGSNANGEWVRWEDGTQMCWAKITVNGVAIVYCESPTVLFRSEAILFTYPASFIDVPTMSAGLISTTSGGNVICALGIVTTENAWVRAYREVSTTIDLDVHYIAIGRWK